MYLKKLEIYGFKSFAERIDMSFGQGITGVVGPNGCGKSNIADAVRWVLGEQSARVLRGGKMEDVIFGGTESRKALAYCEVSLTFDNGAGLLPVDYQEVMVTRRIYRSGESEYYLNKTACRLKDITELFRDTGIGKEGYSLIGQGRIDEILSVRSEDRRGVFEEAAGISKYKARKEEAERRLAHTQQNIERAQDILGEMASQLEPLGEQAEAARRYLSLAGELRELELNDFLHRHDAARERIAELERQMASVQEESGAGDGKEEELRAAIENAQAAIERAEGELTAAREEELSLTRSAQAAQGALELLREREAQQLRDRERYEREEEEAAEALRALEQQEQGVDPGSADHLVAQRSAIEALEAQDLEQAQDIAAREEALEERKAAIIEGMNRLSGVKSAQARLAATREGLAKRLADLSGANQQDEAQYREAEQALSEADARHRAAKAALEELAGQAVLIRKQAQEAASAKDEAAALLTRTQNAAREAASRLKLLEQMERDYEGYQHSVREVMRGASGDPGILGVVAEAIRVPKEYERAIDMTLGGQLQHIICRTQEDAKRHIDRLRDARAGRATFLPLDAVRPRLLTQQERACLSMPGCIGLASELVSFDEIYRPVAENLLGRTVVAQDLTSGIAIMRRANHAFRLVTLEGDVMHSGGSMTGGSVQSRMTSLLSREREIGEYRQAVARLAEREKEAQGAALAQEEALDALRQDLILLQEKSHEQEIAIEREATYCDAARARLEERSQLHQRAVLEREQIESSLEDIDRELATTDSASTGQEQGNQQAQEEVRRLSGELSSAREALEELRAELSRKKVALAAAEREYESALRDQSRREQERQSLMAEGVRRRALLEELKVSLAEKTEQILVDQRTLETDHIRLSQSQQTYRAMEIRRVKLQQELRECQIALEDMQKSRAEWVDRHHRLEMQVQRLQSELENLIARMWETYEITYAGAQEHRRADFAPAKAGARIEEIRRQIRQMGSVNTNAIEDYAQTLERHNALKTQHDDLIRAQEDLDGIILGLARKMAKQFTEQFEILDRNFNITFRQLFGGGRAQLRLTDEANPLSCGIEIVAQPPGKKLQLLSLLSGGERALTAIAILFSMLRIKPTPFCILDEIEAALDEHNIQNFAGFLEDYARGTQFIVITHRKGTMERCDTLYGVSMAEKGVSSMVSVELSAVEELKNIG